MILLCIPFAPLPGAIALPPVAADKAISGRTMLRPPCRIIHDQALTPAALDSISGTSIDPMTTPWLLLLLCRTRCTVDILTLRFVRSIGWRSCSGSLVRSLPLSRLLFLLLLFRSALLRAIREVRLGRRAARYLQPACTYIYSLSIYIYIYLFTGYIYIYI